MIKLLFENYQLIYNIYIYIKYNMIKVRFREMSDTRTLIQ